MNLRPILLVEDNNDDAFFMQRAFETAAVGNKVSIASDGEAAIEFLSSPDASNELTRPCLVLLDLKLPYKSGFDVLEWIRAQPALRTLAVVVLTSSNEHSDISRALELGANAYIVKPSAYADLTKLVTAIRDFWLRHHRPCI
ncbi:MAG TPA: response regulator [Opitutaceae bacterium]|nr:response regulator [Opitutaceae bacterium]